MYLLVKEHAVHDFTWVALKNIQQAFFPLTFCSIGFFLFGFFLDSGLSSAQSLNAVTE